MLFNGGMFFIKLFKFLIQIRKKKNRDEYFVFFGLFVERLKINLDGEQDRSFVYFIYNVCVIMEMSYLQVMIQYVVKDYNCCE